MTQPTSPITGANLIAGREGRAGTTTFAAPDPRTGAQGPDRFHAATTDEVDAAVEAAADAAGVLADAPPSVVAGLLRGIVRELEALGDVLVDRADVETALGRQRLVGELARTCGQLHAFADLVEVGTHHGAILTSAAPDATPPRPDLRRMLVPVGPVAVFGASNFPLAFSVPGGDTAAALAAGCPVVAKAHPSHPATSELAGRAITAAVEAAGLPAGVFCLLQGDGPDVGRALVLSPRLEAVGFTGSLRAGRSLFDLAAGRPRPIPVYAEMGSVNPVFVTEAAAAARGGAIAAGFAASMTMGVGQFCTKPGLAFVPSDEAGDDLVAALASELAATEPAPMLNPGIRETFDDQVARTRALDGVQTLVEPRASTAGGTWASTALLQVQLDTLLGTPELLEEHFGPVAVVVRTPADRLLEAATRLPGSLTATVHAEDAEVAGLAQLLSTLRERVGRLVWNGFPTGVAVTAAQQHGGPYPSTTSPGHTSVGTTAIRRFQRPVAYQDLPDAALPPALRDANPLGIPREVDGKQTTAPRNG